MALCNGTPALSLRGWVGDGSSHFRRQDPHDAHMYFTYVHRIESKGFGRRIGPHKDGGSVAAGWEDQSLHLAAGPTPHPPRPRVTATVEVILGEVFKFRVHCSGLFPLFSTRKILTRLEDECELEDDVVFLPESRTINTAGPRSPPGRQFCGLRTKTTQRAHDGA
jgi:hypothetical protein